MNRAASIEVAEDGYSLPVEEILTGRGLCCGKSGSGKTNTVSVIVERLLDDGLPLLIVDTEGEYFPLTEVFEMLHVGPTEADYDRRVTEETVPEIVDLSLRENVPVILDVSGFDQEDAAKTIVEATVGSLFEKEKSTRKPYLLVVEEIHEYVPQQGSSGSLGETIIRIAKRGRKRGLGVCGVSQRPAAVSKEFITQCDWLVWHRLTWKNDVDVVRRILGSEYADQIPDLATGEAFVMADWDDEVTRVTFQRKETRDAGSTPGLEAIETTNHGSLSDAPADPDAAAEPAGEDPEALAQRLAEKDRKIRELEAKIDRLEDGGEVTGSSGDGRRPPENGEEPDSLLIELANVLVYLLTAIGRSVRRAIAAGGSWLARASRTHRRPYRRQRSGPYSLLRRLVLLLGTIVLLAAVAGVIWLGIERIGLLGG